MVSALNPLISRPNAGYYITRRKMFNDLHELVEHYKVDPDGLCVALREPCRPLEQPATADLSHNTKDQVWFL
jgi:fyn-related kinase